MQIHSPVEWIDISSLLPDELLNRLVGSCSGIKLMFWAGLGLSLLSTVCSFPLAPKAGAKITTDQALSSFNSTQSLSPPSLDDIDDYRDYLYAEQPIAEAETHFLDPEEDLVTISRHGKRRRHPHRSNSFGSGSVNSSAVSSRASATPALSQPPSPSTVISPTAKPVKTPKVAHKATAKNTFFILAGAAALAILIPILTFLVVPALVGRVIITILVTLSVTTILLQSHLVNSKLLLSQEGGMCVGLYGGIMLVIAGIMA